MKQDIVLLISLLLSAFLISSCGGKKSGTNEAETLVPVEVTTIKLGEVVQSLSYNGDIRAEFEVRVFSKIPDRIEKFFVDAGDAVKIGQPIAKVIATTIEQGVRQAEAGLVSAKAQEANLRVEFERAQRLKSENAMSEQQFDAIKTQYEATKALLEQAEAGLKTVKTQLDDATVTAPISGIIGNRYFEAGDMASPAMPLVTVVQMDRVKIIFNATEEDLGRLEVGQKALSKIKTWGDIAFEGKVAKISPVLDPLTRMAEVEIVINNYDHKLKPGMYAQVEVIIGVIEQALVVPRFATIENTSMVRNNGEDQVIKNYFIFVVDSSKAHQRKLKVQYVNHRFMAVDSGVAVGEKLVISGQNNLRDGMSVAIVNAEDKGL